MAKPIALAPFFSPAQWKAAFVVSLILGTLAVSPSGNAQEHRITTFDVPGAGTAAGQGTLAYGINSVGVIAGTYYDAENISHGFLRDPGGKLTMFDVPGDAGGTTVLGLNAEGAVVGYFVDATPAIHAFLRTPDGKFITYDAPGACTTSVNVGCHGSGAWDINILGVVVGPYEDTSGNFVAHCAIRYPDGQFTTFEVPGSSMEAGQGTLPAILSGLNIWGAISGEYYDANNAFHGFLRTPTGAFIHFEAPGADTTISFNGTFPESLNDAGAIAGYDLDVNEVYHGFLRSPAAGFTTFEVPGADTTAGDYNGTFPSNINLSGAITGNYVDANDVSHGFLRGPNGGFTTFEAPGADTTAGDYNGTFPVSNNGAGAITGYYIDTGNVYHGFIREP